MLMPRVIPCLLMTERGLVKTENFRKPRYIGDPLNAVKIFNEKKADELIILDIEATVKKKPPNFRLIENIAQECRMPICYGGGIKTVDQALRIISSGIEKIALSDSALRNQNLVGEIAGAIGVQSVAVVLDIRRKKGLLSKGYSLVSENANTEWKASPLEAAIDLQSAGIGELVVNFVDQDGRMQGFDIELIKLLHSQLKIPMTVLGGAGHLSHLGSLYKQVKVSGIAAGSLFVYKGRYKAVLINYPALEERELCFSESA